MMINVILGTQRAELRFIKLVKEYQPDLDCSVLLFKLWREAVAQTRPNHEYYIERIEELCNILLSGNKIV